MTDFVSCNIQRSQSIKRITITISHTRTIPEGIVIVRIVVYITIDRCPTTIETVSTMYIQKVIISHFSSPVCIQCRIVFGTVVPLTRSPIVVIVNKINGIAIACTSVTIVGIDTIATGIVTQTVTTRSSTCFDGSRTTVTSSSCTSNQWSRYGTWATNFFLNICCVSRSVITVLDDWV